MVAAKLHEMLWFDQMYSSEQQKKTSWLLFFYHSGVQLLSNSRGSLSVLFSDLLVLWIFSIPSRFPPDFICIPKTNVKLSLSFSFWTQWKCDVYMYRFLEIFLSLSRLFLLSMFPFSFLFPSSFDCLIRSDCFFSEGKWDLQQFPCIYSLGDPRHWPQSLLSTDTQNEGWL